VPAGRSRKRFVNRVRGLCMLRAMKTIVLLLCSLFLVACLDSPSDRLDPSDDAECSPTVLLMNQTQDGDVAITVETRAASPIAAQSTGMGILQAVLAAIDGKYIRRPTWVLGKFWFAQPATPEQPRTTMTLWPNGTTTQGWQGNLEDSRGLDWEAWDSPSTPPL
jgi:hypothetical protein